MGANDWMLVYASTDVSTVLRTCPEIDREATRALIERLYPSHDIHPITDGTLRDSAAPPDGEVYAAVFPGVSIVCTRDAAEDTPSSLPPRFVQEAAGRTLYLHAKYGDRAYAWAIWSRDGTLRRSFSFSWDNDAGWIEDIGAPLALEKLNYAEYEDEDDDYPVEPPLGEAEAVLQGMFGFNYERKVEYDDPVPEYIDLAGFAVMPRLGSKVTWLHAR
ncbi:hypothetical protein LFM09_22180 [Lentzea alba]|uniref:DUF6928 family protein n=1 Tax=Lentzea alba TaxID=2714351 RepID=UPI0039BEEC66